MKSFFGFEMVKKTNVINNLLLMGGGIAQAYSIILKKILIVAVYLDVVPVTVFFYT